MSSRLFRGGTPEASPIQWRPAGGSLPSSPGAASSAAQEAQIEAAFARGLAQGESTAAQRAGALAEPVLQNFGAAVRDLLAARQQARRDAEEAAVRLSIAIARRILRREIATDPEAILGLVRAGLDRVEAREVHRLRLSPGDAQVVLDNHADLALPSSIEIRPDASLTPGSAVFETLRGELDVSAQTQLEEIERGFTDRMIRRRA